MPGPIAAAVRGIQADIKTITMLGGYAMTAVTAITAQNSRGVHGVLSIPAQIVLDQIDAVISDIGIDAVKIGMIGSADTADAVAERLRDISHQAPIVFDPVMVATQRGASGRYGYDSGIWEADGYCHADHPEFAGAGGAGRGGCDTGSWDRAACQGRGMVTATT